MHYSPTHDFFLCVNNARKAARRNDIAMVERWLKAAERHLTMSKHWRDLDEHDTALKEALRLRKRMNRG